MFDLPLYNEKKATLLEVIFVYLMQNMQCVAMFEQG